jgi:hypothetical protein
MITDNKLSPNFAWLFALVTLGVTIGINYVIPHVVHHPLTPKALAGVYFAIYAGGATLAVLFTQARALRVVGTFSASALGLGIFFYEVVAKMFTAIASGLGASSSAASGFGSKAGLMLAIGFTFLAIVASIGGAIFGTKIRGSIGQVAALRKA